VKRYHPYSVLSLFPIPLRPWEEITLDFIIRLLLLRFQGKVFNSILVIIDRYIKIARYIITIKDIIAVELIELFILYIIKDFSILKGMTLDRGPVFISKF
jgi:hypothetical protein